MGSESFQVGEHLEIGAEQQGNFKLFLHILPYIFLPFGYSWVAAFYSQPVIQYVNVSLSSVSHFSKLTEPQEEAVETSTAVWSEAQVNLLLAVL